VLVDKTVSLTNPSDASAIELSLVQGGEGPPAVDISALYSGAGFVSYDPGFMSTASCNSALTYIDGDRGILRYRGYPMIRSTSTIRAAAR